MSLFDLILQQLNYWKNCYHYIY